jgi:hypothetical protein
MKKSTLIYSLMFVLMFLLPSFVIPQDKEKEVEKIIHKTSQGDSLLIQFSNPEITVKDARLEQKTDIQIGMNKELIDQFIRFNEAIESYNVSRERRWSVMDRIEAETGYKPVDIAKFIDQKRKLYRWYAALAIIYMTGVVIIYKKDFRTLKGLIIFPILLWSVLVGTIYVYINMMYQSYDTYMFWELLKHLSP